VSAVPPLPPGPNWPSAVQTALWLRRPLFLLRTAAARYGEPFTLRISGWGTLVMVSSPSVVREVFHGEPESYHTGEANALMRPLVGDSSVFVIDGSRHRRVRQRLVAGLRRCSFPDLGLAHQAVLRALDRASARSLVRFHDVASSVTLEVVARATLGLDRGPVLDRAKELLRAVLGPLGSMVAFLQPLQLVPGPVSPAFWLRRAVTELDALVYEEIGRRRQEGSDGDDLLSALLRDSDGADALTDQEIRDQLISVIAAGNDTVATALCWGIYWIHREPAVRERLQDEVAHVDPTSADAFASLGYLDAVVNESLRLCPVVELMSRVSQTTTVLRGHEVPPGLLVSACSYLTHRDPTLYDEPDRFWPERFLRRSYSATEFYPFGGGVRRCLGAHASISLLKCMLCTVVQTYDVEPVTRRLSATRRNVIVAPSRRTPMRVVRSDR
jgi:cytochrome P450 family 110